MSKLTIRDPEILARVVPHLPPETLHQLIRHRGLEACGELVAAATPAQLTALLDLDLWRQARPGRDDLFDVDRFGEWLEVLVDTGDSVAAKIIAALDKNLVIAGLSRYVRVFDPGIFEPTAQTDDESIDRHDAMREGGGHSLECEMGSYVLRARRLDAWDAIVTLLVALDGEYPNDFHALMEGCRALSNSDPEASGFHDLLLAPEQHLHDVTIERERRRSQQGYASAADARAFLETARQGPGTRTNPIVAAYFRDSEEVEEASNETARGPQFKLESQSLDAVMEILAEAGVVADRPRALLEAPHGAQQSDRLTHLSRLMSYVRDSHDAAYFARSRELAFLANALLAGCSIQARPFTPQEASDAAASICNLGLDYWPARWRTALAAGETVPPDALLVDHDLVTAFEVGWSVLHRDVCVFASEQLIAMLADIDSIDRDTRLGLIALQRALIKHRERGTPWLARDAVEILAMLDITAWVSVRGLLDECPILPAALTAVLEGRTTTVSATAFDFISSAAQVRDVRLFMQKLPGLLSGG